MPNTAADATEALAKRLSACARELDLDAYLVSWEDCQRGTSGSDLGSMGPNIMDASNFKKDGTPIFVIHGPNHDEQVISISPRDIFLADRPESADNNLPRSLNFEEFLKDSARCGKYAGLESNIYSHEVDQVMGLRIKAAFIPIGHGKDAASFGTCMFSYGTDTVGDPQNLLLLCTSKGTSIQESKPGNFQLAHHKVGPDGTVTGHWVGAKMTQVKAVDMHASSSLAAEPTKNQPLFIGPQGMGAQGNLYMTIQVPVKQTRAPPAQTNYFSFLQEPEVYRGAPVFRDLALDEGDVYVGEVGSGEALEGAGNCKLSKPTFLRHEDQRPTATLMLVFPIDGDLPTPEGVTAACQEVCRLNKLFQARPLSQTPELTKEITLASPVHQVDEDKKDDQQLQAEFLGPMQVSETMRGVEATVARQLATLPWLPSEQLVEIMGLVTSFGNVAFLCHKGLGNMWFAPSQRAEIKKVIELANVIAEARTGPDQDFDLMEHLATAKTMELEGIQAQEVRNRLPFRDEDLHLGQQPFDLMDALEFPGCDQSAEVPPSPLEASASLRASTKEFKVERVGDLAKELTAKLTKEITAKLTAKLTEEITAKLTKELTVKLTKELTVKLSAQIKTSLMQELVQQLTN